MNCTYQLVRPVGFPAIDGIRFFAAFGVFVQHAIGGTVIEYFKVPAAAFSYASTLPWLGFLFYLADGNRCVDLFFLISGFLMARVVLKDPPGFSWRIFLVNRVTRIYPAFLASLVVTAWVVVTVFDWPWKPMAFLQNMLFLNALKSLSVLPYNHVTWSLGYEFFFYLIVPALVVLSKRLDPRLAVSDPPYPHSKPPTNC